MDIIYLWFGLFPTDYIY